MTHNQRALHGLSKAFFDSDLVATRLMLFVGELFWAIMLWWPGDTFTRPTYEMMAELACEHTWAIAFTITAILQFYIVALELQDSKLAKHFAVWNAVLWVATVTMMLASVYPPPAAIGMEIAGALAAVWIATRPLVLSFIDHRCAKIQKEVQHA